MSAAQEISKKTAMVLALIVTLSQEKESFPGGLACQEWNHIYHIERHLAMSHQ